MTSIEFDPLGSTRTFHERKLPVYELSAVALYNNFTLSLLHCSLQLVGGCNSSIRSSQKSICTFRDMVQDPLLKSPAESALSVIKCEKRLFPLVHIDSQQAAGSCL